MSGTVGCTHWQKKTIQTKPIINKHGTSSNNKHSAALASEKVPVNWKRSMFVLNLTIEWQPSPQGIQQIPTVLLPATSTTRKKVPHGGSGGFHPIVYTWHGPSWLQSSSRSSGFRWQKKTKKKNKTQERSCISFSVATAEASSSATRAKSNLT